MAIFIIKMGIFLGILLVGLLVYFHKKNNEGNFLLAISYFCIVYALAMNYLNQTLQFVHFPFLIRTGNIAGYLIASFFYLFVRNTFYPGKSWKNTDWLLLLPAAFYTIDMIPFFMSDPEYKIAVMKANVKDPTRMLQVSEGWIGIKGLHLKFRYIWGAIMTAASIRLIIINWNNERKGTSSGNRAIFWFIFCLAAMQVPLIFPGIYGAVVRPSWFSMRFISINLALVLFGSAIFILFSPSILYGFLPRPFIKSSAPLVVRSEPTLAPFGNNQDTLTEKNPTDRMFIGEKDLFELIRRIEHFLSEAKPFLNKDYSIHDLSRDVDVPVYQLSPIINQYYKSNFNSWINRYRVNHFISISSKQDKQALTLEALAKESGFSNRNTFTIAFKKEKKITPGNYLKQHLHTA